MSTTARIGGVIPVPLTIFRNDVTYVYISVVEDDGVTPYDLTASVVDFSAKWSILDSTDAISISSANAGEIIFTDPTEGLMKLIFIPANTTSLPVGVLELPYQISITNPSSVQFSALFGTLRVLPNLTT